MAITQTLGMRWTRTAVSPTEPSDPIESDAFPMERLRFIGAATPLVVFIVMLIPWAFDRYFFGSGGVNGYTVFSMLPIPALLFGIAAGGIGLYGFEGANEGGIRAPLLALGCSFFAICTLAYLTVFKTHSNLTPGFESGAIEMRGGWHLSMAVILIGTAGALIPASEFEKSAKIGCWIVTGLFATSGFTFLFLALALRRFRLREER